MLLSWFLFVFELLMKILNKKFQSRSQNVIWRPYEDSVKKKSPQRQHMTNLMMYRERI